ncbi:MAG: TonB-dependent receptor [Thermodesulfobacteriota bacterium]|nr:TonB-dependent receptor [Thermodesulfobacteriota bacterium]
MKITITLITCFAAMFSMAGLSFANSDISKQSSITTEEMVVTASRTEESKKEITQNINIISQEQIKMSFAHDLGDLLQENGIGHIHKYPGGLTTFGIRGFRTETHGNDLKGKVLILLNGRRAGTGNAAKIPVQSIEKVEIIRGPAAVQYGSAAVGGIVNVITKKGQDDPSFYISQTLGSFNYQKTETGLTGKQNQFDFAATASLSSMDAYDTAENNGEKFANTGFDDQTEIYLNLGYEFMPGNRFGVIINSFDVDEQGNPGYFSLQDSDDYKKSENNSFDIIYDGMSSSGKFSWKARYFDTSDIDQWFDPTASNPDGWDDGVKSKMDTDQKGAQAQVSVLFDSATVTTGVDWVKYDIKAAWSPEKTSYENPALFILGKKFFMERKLILSGGIRYDEYDVEVTEPAGRDEDDSNIVPSFGIAYNLNENIKLRTSYGEAFVMPSADHMAADYYTWGTHYVGNSSIEPEKSKTYEAGVDITKGSLKTSLTGFFTDFEDKIESTALENGDKSWKNVGEAEISGFEADFSFDIGAYFGWSYELRPHANLVWLTQYKDKEADEDLKYVSDLVLSYGLTLSDMDGFSTGINFSYESDQDITDYENGTYATIKRDSFTTADVFIAKTLVSFKEYGDISLKTGIKNLFDKDYEFVQGYAMAGRNFYLTLKFTY